MSGVLVVKPTATMSSPGQTQGFAIVPSGTAHGVTSDGADSTYVTDNVSSGSAALLHQVWFTLAAAVMPAGAAITKIRPVVRATQAAGSGKLYVDVRCYSSGRSVLYYVAGQTKFTPVPTASNYAGAYGPAVLTAPADKPEATADYIARHLELLVSTPDQLGTVIEDHRVYDVWAEVSYDEQAVAQSPVLVPSDANTRTTRPALGWAYFDPEGSPQQGYRVVVWSATDAAETNCPKAAATSFVAASDSTVRTAVAHTGTAADPSVFGTASQWQLDVDLTATGAYKAFFQLADLVLGQTRWSTGTGIGELAWTQAVSLPGAPTSTTATWVGSSTWAAQVQVVVPSWTHSPATTRTVLLERTVDAGVTWTAVPTSPSPAADGQVGNTVTMWDAGLRTGQTAQYRARAYHDDGTYQYASTWTNSSNVAASIDRWLLRDPTDGATAPIQLQIAGDLQSQADEQVTFYRPAGSPTDVAVSEDGAVGGEVWPVTAVLVGETAWQAARALRARQATMLLTSDMAGVTSRWVRFGQQWHPRLPVSTARGTASTRARFVDVELREVRPPAGQPTEL